MGGHYREGRRGRRGWQEGKKEGKKENKKEGKKEDKERQDGGWGGVLGPFCLWRSFGGKAGEAGGQEGGYEGGEEGEAGMAEKRRKAHIVGLDSRYT